MELFIMRHGHAETRALTDADRQLTATGRADVARVLGAMQDQLATVTHLWVSPYLRARQTADIASSLLGEMEPFVTELLVPDADPAALLAQLQLCDADALLLVSHQPLVGTLVDSLSNAEPGCHPMATSSLACIDIDLVAPGLGQLRWMCHAQDV